MERKTAITEIAALPTRQLWRQLDKTEHGGPCNYQRGTLFVR